MPQLAEIMGALGRGSDTMAAHVTPGDFVVPRAVIDSDPAVLSAIIKAFGKTSEKMGQPLDWRTHLVAGGMNSQNPISGAPEFFVGGNSEGSGPASGDTGGIGDDGSSGGVSGGGSSSGVSGGAAGDSLAGVDSSGHVGGLAGLGGEVGPGGGGPVSGGTSSTASGDTGDSSGLMAALNSMFSFDTGRNAFEAPDGKPNAYGNLGLALAGLAVPGIGVVGGLANAMGATPSQSNSPQGVDGIEGAIGDALGEGAISRGNAENIWQAVAAYNRPAEAAAPASLGLSGMSTLQQRAAIATGAVASNNPAYRDTSAREYYRNLLQRSFVNDDGSLRDINELLPIEGQYLQQVLGAQPPSTTQALLQAIAAA